MKSLTGLFLILCLFIQAQAQFAFDEEGIFVANPDYSLDRIEYTPLGEDRVLITWSQNNEAGKMTVYGHIFSDENELITEDAPLVISNPEYDCWIGDICQMNDGSVAVIWDEQIDREMIFQVRR